MSWEVAFFKQTELHAHIILLSAAFRYIYIEYLYLFLRYNIS